MKRIPKTHRVAPNRAPSDVPDNKRPINERGPSPMGLPPKPPMSWRVVAGSGTIYHTHS